MSTPAKIAFFGQGAFALPLTAHLQNHNTGKYVLHAYDNVPEVLASLRTEHRHPWLYPGVTMPEGIIYEDSPLALVEDADVIVLAVPSVATAAVLAQIRDYMKDGVVLVNTAKALDKTTGRRLSEVAAEALAGKNYHYAALYGGTIAADLMKGGQPLGMDAACEDYEVAKRIAGIFSSRALRVYPVADLAGVEYSGALKNVISIIIGITHGLNFAYGSETFIFSRAAMEIRRFGVANGARPETFSFESQSFGNDAIMSATGQTRNRQFGVLLASMPASRAIETMVAERRGTVEGIATCSILREAICRSGFSIEDFPIMNTISRVVLDDVPAAEAFDELLSMDF